MRKYNRIAIPKEVLFQKYVIERKSITKVSKEIDVGYNKIVRNLHKYNIQIRKPNETRKIFIDRELLYQKYIIEKKSLEEVGKEIGVNMITIYDRLKEFGIPVRKTSEHRRPKPKTIKISKETLYQKYIIEKKSTAQIAKELNTSPETIRNRLHEFNIPTRNCSESSNLVWGNLEYRERMTKRLKKICQNIELRKKHTLRLKNLWQNPNYRNKMERMSQKLSKTPEFKERIAKGRNEFWNSKEHREQYSKRMKEIWTNPEYREKMIKIIVGAVHKRPTSLEKQFMGFIQTHNLPYKYVGDGEFILGGKNPDFINVNGEKICVDVRSKEVCEHFSQQSPEEYEKQQIEHYSEYGWRCVVLIAGQIKKGEWEFDKSDEEILHFLKPNYGTKTNGGISYG